MCPVHNGSMHVPYDTEKFYYGFPVYILAYPYEEVGVGITTGSSSYSLGQMVMIGCDSTTHAARSIKRSGVGSPASVICAGCERSAHSSSVPAYFGLARFSGERMRSTSDSERSSMSWMTSRTVLPSAAARLPTTSPRWCPITSLK